MNPIYTYDTQQVSVILGGRIIDGFVENSFISASMSGEQWTYHKGRTYGARTRDPNLHGTITFSLMQVSPSNSRLQDYVDAARNGTEDTFTLLIRNNSGGEEVAADSCWVKNETTLTFSKTLEAREWVVESANLRIFSHTSYATSNG